MLGLEVWQVNEAWRLAAAGACQQQSSAAEAALIFVQLRHRSAHFVVQRLLGH
jgi:hypothetical protein